MHFCLRLALQVSSPVVCTMTCLLVFVQTWMVCRREPALLRKVYFKMVSRRPENLQQSNVLAEQGTYSVESKKKTWLRQVLHNEVKSLNWHQQSLPFADSSNNYSIHFRRIVSVTKSCCVLITAFYFWQAMRHSWRALKIAMKVTHNMHIYPSFI
jgi:hypothetical protein